MCDFSEKDSDDDKTVLYCNQRKEMTKKYECFGPIEIPANPRADLSIQERKEFEGKIKLEKKLIDRSGSHKMLYRHFQVMKSIWGGSPNVDPVDLGYDSILEDFDSLIKE